MNKPATASSNPTKPEKPSDAELVAATRAGSEAAFRELVDRHREGVYRLAYRIVRDEEEAKDVAQEAFIRAYRSLGGFAGRSSLFTWLYRIARNVALDHLRRRKTGRLVSLEESPGDEQGRSLSEVLPDAAPSATRLAADAETLARVRAAMDRLSEKHRVVLELREFEGKSYQEIADAVGCNVGTVMSRLFYARNQLARWLRPYLEAGEDKEKRPT